MRQITLRSFDQEKERILALLRTEALPFDDDSPAAKTARKERCRNDLLEFTRTYMPHYVPEDFSPYHEELDRYCSLKNEPVFFSGPKGTGKSVLVTIADTVKAMLYKQRMFTIIASETEDQAADRASYIQFEFEFNPRIRQDFGDLRGAWLWEGKDFVLSNGARCKARGLGQQVAGLIHRNFRPDGFRIEDMESEQSARNPKRVKQIIEWVIDVALGGLGPNFSFIWGGNIISKRCALYKLISMLDDSGRKRYQGEIFQLLQKDGTSLCPGIWPLPRIERMKRIMGPVSFNKVYQNDPIDPDAKFRPEWIRTISLKQLRKRKNLQIKVYNDPIVEPTSTSDSAAILVGGLDLDTLDDEGGPTLVIVDAVIRPLTPGHMIDHHYVFNDRWHAGEHWFESVGFSAWLQRDFDRAAIKRPRLNVRPYKTPQINKEVRIDTLTSPIERGKIVFVTENGDVNVLIEQLLYHGNAGVPDDGPDALAALYAIFNRGTHGMMYGYPDDEN